MNPKKLNQDKLEYIESPTGKQAVDASGSPVGIVRMDPEKSYAGIGDLLQDYINNGNQPAWEKIKAKIDYTFESIDLALSPLAKKTNFQSEIRSRINKGQKLLFKPNLVFPTNIDPQSHGPGMGSTACTEWPFMAALMRWFREKLEISYHQMSIGEAATGMTAIAGQFTFLNQNENRITTEAVIEGRSNDFYGGWGFYFARKYLSERLGPDQKDNPMNGYEESIRGTYIPPGQVKDKLMVYDLNRIFDDLSKGRSVGVPGGINYDAIMLHKVVVGGDPVNEKDLNDYPGCILVNVPKFKVHVVALFTNVIKNLGIGLYPMQYAKEGGCKWNYSTPHNPVPGMKSSIPHQVWVPELDPATHLPKEDEIGNPLLKKTGGITATMIDIIKAVKDQNIFMIHIVDAVEGINLDHQGIGIGTKEPEGMVFAGIDPVATDLLCARYMFSNVPIKEALASGMEDGHGGLFPQAVPIPALEGNNIVSKIGFDCPLSRDVCFHNAQMRGLGVRTYHAIGHDRIQDRPIVSVKGHIGFVNNGSFSDIVTKTMYFAFFKMPWDLQKTTLHYLAAVDNMTGSSLKKDFLAAYDENKDGIVTYEEMGKKGELGFLIQSAGEMVSDMPKMLNALKGGFKSTSTRLKFSDASFNPLGKDFFKAFNYTSVCTTALQMSRLESESPDFFVPGVTWGNGKWPSFQFAAFLSTAFALYGKEFPEKVLSPSLYSTVLRYADLTQNNGEYLGREILQPDPERVHQYVLDASQNNKKQLDFTLYVPEGYDNIAGLKLPNVEATNDPARMLTASFKGGDEIWA